jgi:hypothetical protein
MEVLAEMSVPVQRTQNIALLLVVEVQENLMTSQQDGHLSLNKPKEIKSIESTMDKKDLQVFALIKYGFNKRHIVENNRTSESLEWFVELQVQVFGNADQNLVVRIRSQWSTTE